MKLSCLKFNKQLIATIAVVIAISFGAFSLFESNKDVKIHNAKEASELVKKHVQQKKLIPALYFPVLSAIQFSLDSEIFTSKALSDEPCAVIPDGRFFDQPGSTTHNWMVLMSSNTRFATAYIVDPQGKIGRQHCDVDIRYLARNHSNFKSSKDVIWNLPEDEHAKLIEEAKRNGSKCTYY